MNAARLLWNSKPEPILSVYPYCRESIPIGFTVYGTLSAEPSLSDKVMINGLSFSYSKVSHNYGRYVVEFEAFHFFPIDV